MRFNDYLQFKGVFKQRIYRLVDDDFVLEEEYVDNNLVVSVGREKVSKLLANDGVGNYISAVAVGTSVVEPTIADTAITDPFTKNVTGYSYPATGSVQFNWTLELTEANGKAISEYGLMTQDGTLFARKTRGTVNKESDVKIEGEWTIIVN